VDSRSDQLKFDTDYNFAVENLPEDYEVKSATYGAVDLTSHPLNIPTSASAFNQPNQPTSFRGLTAVAPSTIVVTLGSKGYLPSQKSARVTGRLRDTAQRAIYISGSPGIIYSDGTFEFRNVVPGRHSIVSTGPKLTSPVFASSLVVGEHDIGDVELVPVPVLPAGIISRGSPGPAGSHAPGIVSLVSIRGQIVEESSGMPLAEGTAFIVGERWATIPVDSEGKFELKNLLPGTYSLTFLMTGYKTYEQSVVVVDDDIRLPRIELN
jgi:hypothetical protein